VSLARNLYSLTSYRRTYAVLYIHEPQNEWAEITEREAIAESFFNKDVLKPTLNQDKLSASIDHF
jgi:hypothetical protein